MENNLKKILDNFQQDPCEIVAVMHSVMMYFQYPVEHELFYWIGNARILELPFAKDCETYMRKCFAYVNDVCYYAGAWDADFITTDAEGFANKLKEKWFEWADMQQAMPIIAGLLHKHQEKVSFYILAGYQKEEEIFECINGSGEVCYFTEAQIKNENKLYGFATIDVPYNFLVKSKYYRSVEMASIDMVRRTGYALSNCTGMKDILTTIAKSDSSSEEKAKKMFEHLLSSQDKYHIPDDLYRKGYGTCLVNQGYKDLGEQYFELARRWEELLVSHRDTGVFEVDKARAVAEKELKIIDMQKRGGVRV